MATQIAKPGDGSESQYRKEIIDEQSLAAKSRSVFFAMERHLAATRWRGALGVTSQRFVRSIDGAKTAMGMGLSATCKCGFSEHTAVGAGMADFQSNCAFPCFCTACRQFHTVNVFANDRKCPNCRADGLLLYDDPVLNDHSSDDSVADWNAIDHLGRQLILTRSRYFCPGCQRLRMKFGIDIMFD